MQSEAMYSKWSSSWVYFGCLRTFLTYSSGFGRLCSSFVVYIAAVKVVIKTTIANMPTFIVDTVDPRLAAV